MFSKNKIARLALAIIAAMIFVSIAGCDSDIVEKVMLKQQLTPEEQKRYEAIKGEADKAVHAKLEEIADIIIVGNEKDLQDNSKAKLGNNRELVEEIINKKLSEFSLKLIAGIDLDDNGKKIRDRYAHRLQKEVVPAMEKKLHENKKVVYRTEKGEVRIFDVSENVHKLSGFNSGDRISTQWGNATVIGIYEDKLWFHLEGKKGATYWSKIDETFKLLEPRKNDDSRQQPQKTAIPIMVEKKNSVNVQMDRRPTDSSIGSNHAEGIYFEKLDPIPPMKYLR